MTTASVAIPEAGADPATQTTANPAVTTTASTTTANPSATATPAAAPERPAWLPEKFTSAEQMASAYKELEGKLAQPKPGTEKAPEGTKPAVEGTVQTPAEAAKALETAGLDMDKYVAAHVANGKLSDAEYAELAGKGFDKKLVDNYIAGQAAQSTVARDAILAPIGGEAEFVKATEWAKANMSAKEIKAFNSIVTAGTPEDATFAVQGLYARFKGANPNEPNLIGGKSADAAPQGYASAAQVTEAMRDPRYRKDPAFRAEVERRVGASKVFGVSG